MNMRKMVIIEKDSRDRVGGYPFQIVEINVGGKEDFNSKWNFSEGWYIINNHDF